MGLKVSKNIILPSIDRIRDPETRSVLQELIKAIQDMNSTYYNDLTYLCKEGEWTPALKFGGNSAGMTYDIQSGLYTKIGRLVAVTGYIKLIAKGTSTGSAVIRELPFTSRDEDGAYTAVSLRFNKVTFAEVFQGQINENTSDIQLNEITEAGSVTAIVNTNFANDSRLMISITYMV